MALARRRADQPVAVRPEGGERHLGDDAAVRRTEIVERGATGLRDDARHHAIEPFGRAAARHLELGEARQVEHRDALLHRLALAGDRGMPRGSAERHLRAHGVASLGEIHSPLPAAACAELRALVPEAGVDRRGLGRTAGRAFLGRITDAVLVLVGLDRLREHEAVVVAVEVAARVERPHVPLGLAMRDPLCDELAGAARLRDAEGEGAAVVETRQARRRPEQRVAVRRVGDRPVDDALHADRPEDGHALAGGLDVLLDAPEVVVEQLVRELVRQTLEPMRLRVPLVGTEDQPVALLAQVVADIRVAQQRHAVGAARGELRDVLGDEVLVRERDDGQIRSDHRRHLAATVARGVDHLRCLDHALVGGDAPLAGGCALDGRDPGLAVDGRTRIARALGERLRELCGVDVAVVRVVEPRLDVVGGDERVPLADLGGREHLELDALRARLRHHMLELVHPVGGVREPDAARDVVVHVVADTRTELRIELGAVALQLDEVPGGGEVRAVARRVPGGTGRQLVALDEHGVAHTELGQMVERAAADGAAADDHHLSMGLHLQDVLRI